MGFPRPFMMQNNHRGWEKNELRKRLQKICFVLAPHTHTISLYERFKNGRKTLQLPCSFQKKNWHRPGHISPCPSSSAPGSTPCPSSSDIAFLCSFRYHVLGLTLWYKKNNTFFSLSFFPLANKSKLTPS